MNGKYFSHLKKMEMFMNGIDRKTEMFMNGIDKKMEKYS